MSGQRPLRTLIIGAGIGGLTLAIALRQRGCDVVVFERVDDLQPVGAGLVIATNGTKALRALGLEEELIAAGAIVQRSDILSWQGTTLQRAPMAVLGRQLGAPAVGIHRAALQKLLLEALGQGVVHLNSTCTGFSQVDTGVVAQFADGREERGDLLIGADGIHSAVRASLLRDGPPRYAGYTCWRGIAAFSHPRFTPGLSTESWGKGARFGMVDIGHGHVYWFATKNAPQGGSDDGRSRQEIVQEIFRGWHEPIEALVAATDEASIIRNDIVDRPPIDRWSAGRVTLLGDAAHPTTPNLGQGACLALEDAVVLANQLDGTSDIPSALREYEQRRMSRTASITQLSWRFGRLTQSENPVLIRLRDQMIRWTPGSISQRQLKSIVGYEVR